MKIAIYVVTDTIWDELSMACVLCTVLLWYCKITFLDNYNGH